jgi:hypothetical protein
VTDFDFIVFFVTRAREKLTFMLRCYIIHEMVLAWDRLPQAARTQHPHTKVSFDDRGPETSKTFRKVINKGWMLGFHLTTAGDDLRVIT